MGKLCFGSYTTLLKEAVIKTVKADENVVPLLLHTIDPNTESWDKSDCGKWRGCKENLPSYISSLADKSSVITSAENYFANKIIPVLESSKSTALLEQLHGLIKNDNGILPVVKTDLLRVANLAQVPEFLAKTFIYAVRQDNIASSPLDGVVAVPLPAIRTTDAEFGEELVPTFTTTLDPHNFNGVFKEIEKRDNPFELTVPNHIHFYHLHQIENNEFVFDDLQEFLEYNIGNYIYSRAALDKMSLNERDKRLIGKRAIELLRKNGGLDKLGDELSDIILYVFLEQVLKAPKIYSKIQLTENGEKAVNKGGVHLLRLTSPTESYQLVIGKSSIVGDLKTAIDNAFLAIVDAKNSRVNERNLLDSRILNNQSFSNPADVEYLKSVIFPTKEKTPTSNLNNAFGVFLGYSLGIDSASTTDEQFRSAIIQKMQADVALQTAYIIEKIKVASLGAYSFYFYLLPFNDADNDKLSIMRFLLVGESVC